MVRTPVISNLPKAAGRGTRKLYSEAVAGPASYATGGFTVSTGLATVENAVVSANGGYLAEVASISGGDITVRVRYFDYAATSAGVAVEVPAETDLSGVTFRIIAVGYS